LTPAAKLALTIGLLAGLVLGLYIGWEAVPPEGANSGLASLRADYKADYAIMVAEIFAADHDPAAAETRLARLGLPAAVLPEAYAAALNQNRSARDLDRLAGLAAALSVEIPVTGSSPR